jgi:transcription factor SPN1
MEDLDPNALVPGVDAPLPEGGLPEAGHDPGDPLAPDIEEENNPNAPIAFPYQDVEVTGENEVDKDDDDDDDDLSDNESLLSDVDEAQFQDFDPAAISLEDREQIAIDDDNVKLLGVHKRKRTEAETEEARKKKKEKRREKGTKKARRRRDGSEPFSGGEELDGKRRRKRNDGDAGEGGSGSQRRRAEGVDESLLSPEERKRRELDRAMDEALKGGKTRMSKKDGIVRSAKCHTIHARY